MTDRAVDASRRTAALTGVSYPTVSRILRVWRQGLEARTPEQLAALSQEGLRDSLLHVSGRRGGRGREPLRRIRTTEATYVAVRDFVRNERVRGRSVTPLQVLLFLLERTEGVLEVKADPKEPDDLDKKDKAAALRALSTFLQRHAFVVRDGGLVDALTCARRVFLARIGANRTLPPSERRLEVWISDAQTALLGADPRDATSKPHALLVGATRGGASFASWFKEQLLPNLPRGRGCLIVLSSSARHRSPAVELPGDLGRLKKAAAIAALVKLRPAEESADERAAFLRLCLNTRRRDLVLRLQALASLHAKPAIVEMAAAVPQKHVVLFVPPLHGDFLPEAAADVPTVEAALAAQLQAEFPGWNEPEYRFPTRDALEDEEEDVLAEIHQ